MKRVGLALLIAVGACSPGVDDGSDAPSDSTIDSTAMTIPRGETPGDVFEAVTEDLSFRLGVPADSFGIVRDEAATWSDGSLGCSKPGETHTPGPESGYWLVLVSDGFTYDYRARDNGTFVYCESPSPRGAPTG